MNKRRPSGPAREEVAMAEMDARDTDREQGGRARQPLEAVKRLTEKVDRAFQGLLHGGGIGGHSWGWAPPVETFERGDRLVVRAELPGVSQQDVNVELTTEALIIEGERRRAHTEQGEAAYRSEMSYGRFHREIRVPPEVTRPDEAQAEFRDGVLEVSLPLDQSRRGRRRIPIQGQGAPARITEFQEPPRPKDAGDKGTHD
jgi:HSP20 family protein